MQHISCDRFWLVPSSEVAISGIVIRTIVLLLSSWKKKKNVRVELQNVSLDKARVLFHQLRTHLYIKHIPNSCVFVTFKICDLIW